MPTEIKMPALSPTMLDGTLVKWCINEGNTVTRGDTLAEIETDKSILEIESPATGIVARHLYPAGAENIPVGSTIAMLCDNESEVESLKLDNINCLTDNALVTQHNTNPIQSESGLDATTPRLFASPLAKSLASQHNIDLALLTGSGPNGRIIKQDVENVIAADDRAPSHDHFQDSKLSSIRKSIANRLQESKQNIPHFYLTIDVEMDNLLSTREELNESLNTDNISINDFIIKACALSLKSHPKVNAHFLNDSIRQFKNIDIAVATAVDDGLLTPVLRNADKLTLKSISSSVKELTGKARANKLLPEEYQGGTFTLSNLGMFNINQFDAIINPPQVAILAVGAAVKKPIVKADAIIPATILTLTLSCDHRVIDGKEGAELLSTIKHYLENPVMTLA